MQIVREKIEKVEALNREMRVLREDLYRLVRVKVAELGTVIASRILDKDAAYISRLKRGKEPVSLERLVEMVKELYRIGG